MTDVLDREDQQRALLISLAEVEAQDARLYAKRMRVRAEMAQAWGTFEGPEQFGMIELAGTARIGQTRATTQLDESVRLMKLFPGSLALLEAGEMYRETAVLLLQLTANCTEEVQQEVEARLLEQIARANTADVRRLVNDTILEVEADLEPDLTRQRLERGRQRRRVWIRPGQSDDGLNEVTGALDDIATRRWVLDFEELVRVQRIADRRAGIVKTVDQTRADVFATMPSQILALVRALQQGRLEEIRDLASQDPDFVERLEDLASSAPAAQSESSDESEAGAVTEASVVPEPPDQPPTGPPDPSDQRAWELYLGRLLAVPVKNPIVMNIHIPMTTLIDRDNRAGFIEGLGSIPAEHARLLAPIAGLRRLFVCPDSGTPIGLDPEVHPPLLGPGELFDEQTAALVRDRLLRLLGPEAVVHEAEEQHDPSASLAAFVKVRDQRCGGPGCSCPAARSDLDHENRYPDGPTAAWNLGLKSRRCHRAKHAGWETERHPDGRTTWRSPLGHTYERPGVWQAPPKIPWDIELSAPRLPFLDEVDRNPLEGPIWQDPAAGGAADQPEPKAKLEPKPKPRRNPKSPLDDDEPPF